VLLERGGLILISPSARLGIRMERTRRKVLIGFIFVLFGWILGEYIVQEIRFNQDKV